MNKLLPVLILSLFLIGCGSNKTQYIDTSITKPKLNISPPEPIKLHDIQWIIISSNNISKYKQDIENGNLVIIGLDAEDYKLLSLNYLSLVNYIKKQSSIILAYKNYYEKKEK